MSNDEERSLINTAEGQSELTRLVMCRCCRNNLPSTNECVVNVNDPIECKSFDSLSIRMGTATEIHAQCGILIDKWIMEIEDSLDLSATRRRDDELMDTISSGIRIGIAKAGNDLKKLLGSL